MQVVKESEGGIVRRVMLLDDDDGEDVVLVTRFLGHLADVEYSPNTPTNYAISPPSWARGTSALGTSGRRRRWSSSAICGGSRAAVPRSASD